MVALFITGMHSTRNAWNVERVNRQSQDCERACGVSGVSPNGHIQNRAPYVAGNMRMNTMF